MSRVRSINVGAKKGGAKHPVPGACIIEDWGVEGDGHGGPGPKQVSLLAWESTMRMRASGVDVGCGSFGENITTSGLDLRELKVGDKVSIGDEVILEVTERGKECPAPCAIFHQAGYCIMPDEGVFCRVNAGGALKPGDPIVVVESAGMERGG